MALDSDKKQQRQINTHNVSGYIREPVAKVMEWIAGTMGHEIEDCRLFRCNRIGQVELRNDGFNFGVPVQARAESLVVDENARRQNGEKLYESTVSQER